MAVRKVKKNDIKMWLLSAGAKPTAAGEKIEKLEKEVAYLKTENALLRSMMGHNPLSVAK